MKGIKKNKDCTVVLVGLVSFSEPSLLCDIISLNNRAVRILKYTKHYYLKCTNALEHLIDMLLSKVQRYMKREVGHLSQDSFVTQNYLTKFSKKLI